MYTKFRRTSKGITPDPIRAHVVYVGLLADRTLLGEVTDTFTAEDGRTRLHVRHFNGEPWPFAPLLAQVDVLERDYEGV